jgi:hypothetical protein
LARSIFIIGHHLYSIFSSENAPVDVNPRVVFPFSRSQTSWLGAELVQLAVINPAVAITNNAMPFILRIIAFPQ